jgi:hypothetical protein
MQVVPFNEAGDLLGCGELGDAGALAALQQTLPAVRPGDRLDERCRCAAVGGGWCGRA